MSVNSNTAGRALDATKLEGFPGLFVIASVPALVAGLFAAGSNAANEIAQREFARLPGWQGSMFEALGFDYAQAGGASALALGLLLLTPLLLIVLATSLFWTVLFAKVRGRRVDPGWLMSAWLFTLLMPATMPLAFAALGISFGIVFGSCLFGGTGRYLVSPALLGVTFLSLSYPDVFAAQDSTPAGGGIGSWALIVAGGPDIESTAELSWLRLFLGQEAGAFGTPSTIACLLGAAFLALKNAASWRTLAGAVVGVLATAMLLGGTNPDNHIAQLGWHVHLSVGSLAFGIAFLATDPTTAPVTAAGRWVYGVLIGALAISIRVMNPAHPEGSLFAILLASLFVPLIDHFVGWLRLQRQHGGVEQT